MAMGKLQKNRSDDVLMDRLSSEDCRLFFKLYQNLLGFTAQKFDLTPSVKSLESFFKLPMEKKHHIRNILMKRINVIDDFVASNPLKFTPAELEILKSWKQPVIGNFFVINYTQNGILFLEKDNKDPKVYLALALTTPIWELIPAPPPARVETVLLPFKGKIVCDGMINADRIFFGKGISRSIMACYERALMKHGLIESLPFQGSVGFSDEEKLSFYLSTKERREDNWEEIEQLLENEKLLPVFLREMGKANSKAMRKRLKQVGVKRGWFAIANNVVVASSKTREDLEALVENMMPHGKKSVYIFELK